MLKTFQELFELDLSKEISKKPATKNGKVQLEILEWANCLKLLYLNGAEKVRYGSYLNEGGYPCFFNKQEENPFVRVWVEIDNEKFEIEYPVINGIYAIATPSNLEIHKSQQRAFVKAVAINTGLGLSLWIKEEKTLNENKDIQKEINKNNSLSLNDQLTNIFAKALQKVGDKETLYTIIQTTKDEMSKLFRSNDLQQKKVIIKQLETLVKDYDINTKQ